MKRMLKVLGSLMWCAGLLTAQEPSFLNPDHLLNPPGRSSASSPGVGASRPTSAGARAVQGAAVANGGTASFPKTATQRQAGEPVALEVPEDVPVAREVAEPSTVAAPSAASPASAATVAATPVPREQTKVAVLGYHNFSDTRPVSEMRMRTSDFRLQMDYLKKAGITVIGMQDFLDWRFGTKQLPERCVLITIDDGWKSAYTDAFPILKEYGYPFTIFLYTQFITGRGDAMSHDMVKEMVRYGATIGSHSTSHLYPRSWKRAGQGTPAYTAMIDRELGDSARKLEEWFGGKVTTYCYPGGYHTPEMIERAPGYGYVAAFTVIPKKVRYDENPFLIHRYMIFGNNHRIFHQAVNFDGNAGAGSISSAALAPPPPFEVVPAAHASVSPEVPVIQADLSAISGLLPQSLTMKVSGYGRVPCRYDSTSKIVSWTPPTRLYLPNITVQLGWKTNESPARQTATWTFRTDKRLVPKPEGGA